jgi:hypothetical protein
MRVKSGQQRSARRTTSRAIVKLREANAFARELVEIRRVDSAAVTTEVRKSHVIGHDEQNIRTRIRGVNWTSGGEDANKSYAANRERKSGKDRFIFHFKLSVRNSVGRNSTQRSFKALNKNQAEEIVMCIRARFRVQYFRQ